jgi:hypothetical protein
MIVDPAGKFLVLLKEFAIMTLHGRARLKDTAWLDHCGDGFIPTAKAFHSHRGADRSPS